jgi:hypothetical protein
VILAEERSAPPPPEDARIQALLNSLPEEQLYAVALLTYVGRGDFTVDRVIPAYQTIGSADAEGNSPAVSSLGLGQVTEKSSRTAVKDWEVTAVLNERVGPPCIDRK